jgi:hypothetical protein
MDPVRIGRFDRKADLYDVPGTTLDDFGQPTLTGVFILTIPCAITPLRGRQVRQIQTTWPMAYYEIDVPWLGSAIPATPGNPLGIILPRMYLILPGNRRLDIVFAADIEDRHRVWHLTCEEKVTS